MVNVKYTFTFTLFSYPIYFMLTIISGTNRKDSMTSKVAAVVQSLAKNSNTDTSFIDLSNLENDFIHSAQYSADNLPDWLKKLQHDHLIKADKFIIVSPEYNGSIPGYLKLFIDAISVNKLKESFGSKHTALIGVSSGRAGNLRGMDHLSAILHHIGCNVIPGSLPISGIGKVVQADGSLDDDTTKAVQQLLDKLLAT